MFICVQFSCFSSNDCFLSVHYFKLAITLGIGNSKLRSFFPFVSEQVRLLSNYCDFTKSRLLWSSLVLLTVSGGKHKSLIKK